MVDLSAIWTLIPYLLCALALALISRTYAGRARWGLSAVVLVAAIVTACVILKAKPLSYALTIALVAAVVIYWLQAARLRLRTAMGPGCVKRPLDLLGLARLWRAGHGAFRRR